MTLTRAAARTLEAALPRPNSATEHCTANASNRSTFDTTNSWEEAQPQSCSIRAEQLMCSLADRSAASMPLARRDETFAAIAIYVVQVYTEGHQPSLYCLLQILIASALAALPWELGLPSLLPESRCAAPHPSTLR